MIFDDNGYSTEIKFKGFLFESEFSTIGEKVMDVRNSNNIGVNGLDVLRYYGLNPNEYKQLTIEFEKTNYRVTDLICVYKNFELK
ncbi:hypothetical protein [Corallibacter sp.]|uniref:hypothetical protein n=1 Tax=Corallibacter sp. TaxID=2038084 RepID=UPI003AB75EC9